MAVYSSLPDNALIPLLKGNDHAAFTEIYNRFFGLLYIHACRRLNDEDEASDLLQEMFTAIWDKRTSLQLTGNLSGYLYAAMRNRVLNLVEHKKVTNRYMESLAEYTDHDYRFADHMVRETELRKLIEKEINALPYQMKKIFIMSRTEDYSYKQIAEIMNMSEQAVKSQMKRALKTLRVKLGLLAWIYCLIYFL